MSLVALLLLELSVVPFSVHAVFSCVDYGLANISIDKATVCGCPPTMIYCGQGSQLMCADLAIACANTNNIAAVNGICDNPDLMLFNCTGTLTCGPKAEICKSFKNITYKIYILGCLNTQIMCNGVCIPGSDGLCPTTPTDIILCKSSRLHPFN
ncbi:hypothetical protein ACOME3_001266 [Neoechinorhynchus agilis]